MTEPVDYCYSLLHNHLGYAYIFDFVLKNTNAVLVNILIYVFYDFINLIIRFSINKK